MMRSLLIHRLSHEKKERKRGQALPFILLNMLPISANICADNTPKRLMKESGPSNTAIRQLKMLRFRGFEDLRWRPSHGLNLILGGGDVGKSTVLDAISLLLAPTNSYVVTEADYFNRRVADEFEIEAVIVLGAHVPISNQMSMNWPWEWDGQNLHVPIGHSQDQQQPLAFPKETAYCVRVRGTAELELFWEVLQPDGNTSNFSVGLRKAIGLVRLSSDDRNDRDLRLVQGSALSRLLDDRAIRKGLGQELSGSGVEQHLTSTSELQLARLKDKFTKQALPADLGLGITGAPGMSIGPLIGLTVRTDNTVLPLAVWGAGTRRLAALTISDSLQDTLAITVIDEIERGLEPYRQASLMERLLACGNQAFATSHSASIIAASNSATLWYLHSSGVISPLSRQKIAEQQLRNPDIFLARLPVLAEGATEVGFCEILLQRGVSAHFKSYGICIADVQGQTSALNIFEAAVEGRLLFAGIVDSGHDEPGRWAKVKASAGDLLLQWDSKSIEEHVISKIGDDKLLRLIEDPLDELTGARIFTLSRRLGIDGSLDAIRAVSKDKLRTAMLEASTGAVPDSCQQLPKSLRNQFKGDSRLWFKSIEGGRELASKVFELGAWLSLRTEIMRFVNAVRGQFQMQPLDDLT